MILLELFGVFFLIGAFTFGGGYAMIPLIESQVVSRGWMTSADVTNFIAVSESTPGPFAINMATFVGSSQAGFAGSICATLGVILPSFIIILLLVTLLAKFANSKYIKGAINGNKPIVISLISSTIILLMVKTFFFNGSLNNSFIFDRTSLALFILLFGFSLIYKKVFKKNLNTIMLLILSGLCGIILF